MKCFIFLFIFTFSFSVYSQGLESRFFTIDDSTLPQIFLVDQSDFVQKYEKLSFTRTLGISSDNYWRPVSMVDALNKQEAYLNRKNNTKKPFTAETLGFRKLIEKESAIKIEVNNPHHFRRNGVRNSVYRDASMPFFYNPFYNRFVPGTEF